MEKNNKSSLKQSLLSTIGKAMDISDNNKPMTQTDMSQYINIKRKLTSTKASSHNTSKQIKTTNPTATLSNKFAQVGFHIVPIKKKIYTKQKFKPIRKNITKSWQSISARSIKNIIHSN